MTEEKPLWVRVGKENIDLTKLNRNELLRLKLCLESDLDGLKESIFRAEAEYKASRKSTKEQSDWYASAVRARRYKARDLQRIQLRLSEMKKSESKSFADTFIDMARIFLSEDTFAMLIERTEEEVGYQE